MSTLSVRITVDSTFFDAIEAAQQSIAAQITSLSSGDAENAAPPPVSKNWLVAGLKEGEYCAFNATFSPPLCLQLAQADSSDGGDWVKTLHTLEMHPSCNIYISMSAEGAPDVGKGWTGMSEIAEMNEERGRTVEGGYEGWVGEKGERPKVKDIMKAVEGRFEGEDALEGGGGKGVGGVGDAEEKQKREERLRERVDNVRAGMKEGLGKGKKKALKGKVYEMLVKQRAKGKESVRQEDRVYKCVIVVGGAEGEEKGRGEYRFYSGVSTTYGRVGEEFAGGGKRRRVVEGGKSLWSYWGRTTAKKLELPS